MDQNVGNLENGSILIKTNSLGDSLWAKNYGDRGHSCLQTSDREYILTERKDNDVFIIKTDSSGYSIWAKKYGGGYKDIGYSVKETSDGGYIVTGAINHDIFVIKTDSLGILEWYKKYGGNHTDPGYSITEIMDGGYLVTGKNGIQSERDLYLLKLGLSGDPIWTKNFSGMYSGKNNGRSVCETKDNGYVVAGTKYIYVDDWCAYYALWVIKTDSNGNFKWEKVVEGYLCDQAWGCSIQNTIDSGYIVTGKRINVLYKPQIVLFKIKADYSGISEFEGEKKQKISPNKIQIKTLPQRIRDKL